MRPSDEKASDASAKETFVIPTSFAQQRLWIIDQLEPGITAYNISVARLLKGRLSVSVLERSLNEIVRRHEVLRTSIATLDGKPVQVIAPKLTLTVPAIELSELPEAEQKLEVQRLAREEAQRPFDLARGPLLRASLLRLGDQEHVLLLTMHHIVSDGWSVGVLFRELAALYAAFSQGQPSPLHELSIQYADYALWQREWLQGEEMERQLAYWRRQLAGAPAVLELLTDRPRPAMQSFRGAKQSLVLPKDLTARLKDLSRREGVTLFMTLLAAFQTLLSRYTGQADILVGSPIANRNREEIEGLIGFFVNTLVLRTDLSGDPTFRELLGRVSEVALGAYAHQDLPFEKLVEGVQPERSLSHTPLFQVMFILQNAPRQALELPDLRLSPLAVESGTSKFDVTLSMVERADGLTASWEYNTDLFEAATAARMLRHFQTLLEGILADPEQRLSRLPLLTEAERRQLLVEWNNTRADYPQHQAIHRLFEAQVERTPDAMAVAFEDRQLTYRELNARANQLAHHLRKLGVGPEVLVGICLERSLEMVVGLLGILKAGGAYVPLDPAYPKQRLSFMVEDAQLPVLVTQERLVEELPEHSAKVLCLDRDWGLIGQESEGNPASGAGAENLAYVIYTSGSTGKPKGVFGPHRGAVNRFAWMWEAYPFEAEEVCCQKTSLNFVDSIWEIFGPLLQGIRTVTIPEEVMQDPYQLVQALAAQQVTRIVLVPSLLRLLLDAGIDLRRRLPRLKLWVSSGEPLPRELSERFLEAMPQSVLLNLYGSSEVAADVTCYDTRELGAQLSSVPIGRPIANTQILLLDRQLGLVPIGVPGELCVGGDGLARGYLNRPELTAEKFVPHPFPAGAPARLYKTGDLARWLPEGNLEYLGRLDHQVKIRGARVEPGEVEAVLGGHAEVSEAVVEARQEAGGELRLVAYVVPGREPRGLESDEGEQVQAAESGQRPSPTDLARRLRHFLAKRLPAYMLPGAVVVLEQLPRTPNGKVDRRALPAPEHSGAEAGVEYTAPRTAVEQALAEIWAEVLRIERVGIHANFFELGGHSLMATQVISRVRRTLRVELSVRSIFEGPTVAELAERVEAAEMIDAGDASPAIMRVRRDEFQVKSDLNSAHAESDQGVAGKATSLVNNIRQGRVEQLMAKLDRMSDEELNELFRYVMTEGRAG